FLQSCGGNLNGRGEIRKPEVRRGRLAGQEPRIGASAQKAAVLARPNTGVRIEDTMREADSARQPSRPVSLVESADNGAQVRRIVRGSWIGVLKIHGLVRVPGQHVVAAGGMGVVIAGYGPEHAKLVGMARGAGEQFADL